MTGQASPLEPAGIVPGEARVAGALGRRGAAALTVLAVCQGMLIVDASIVTVAAPAIAHGIRLSDTSLTWLFNAYTIAFGGLLLLGGRVGDIVGHRRAFTAGTALFTLASLAGGLSVNGGMLLAARAMQGIGAAFAAPAALALIANTFTGKRVRTRALGIWSAVAASGMVVGLILGGVLTDWAGWRAVFFVNVPVGAALILLAPLTLITPEPHRAKFDLAGALTSTVGLMLLVDGFIRAAANGWADPLTLLALAAGLALIAIFVVIETRTTQPLTPLHLLTNRDRVGAYLIRLLLTGAMSAELFFLTLFLQDKLGFSPLTAAFAFVPTAVPVVIVSRITARLMPRTGAKPLLIAGALITTAGVAWLTQLSAGSSYAGAVLGPIILTGAGVGLLFPAMTVVALAGAAPAEAGAASGMLQVAQQIGGSLGIAGLVTVFDAARGQDHLAVGAAAGFTGGTAIMAAVTLIALFVVRRRA
jgi:EmrB/QacA subfamily drug resistance transporter